MNIYKNIKYPGKKFIGINIEENDGNMIEESVVVDIDTGKIYSCETANMKYVGTIQNGRLIELEEVKYLTRQL